MLDLGFRTYRVPCQDGSEKRVHRNIDKAFPLYIPGWQAHFSTDVAQFAGVSLTGEYASQVQGYLYALDGLNQSLMMTFRAVYATFQSDPCANADFLVRMVELILDRQHQLTTLQLQLRGIAVLAAANPKSDRLGPMTERFLSNLGGETASALTESEIQEAVQATKEWGEASA